MSLTHYLGEEVAGRSISWYTTDTISSVLKSRLKWNISEGINNFHVIWKFFDVLLSQKSIQIQIKGNI